MDMKHDFDFATAVALPQCRPVHPAIARLVGLLYLCTAGLFALPALAIVGVVFVPSAIRRLLALVFAAADTAGHRVLGR